MNSHLFLRKLQLLSFAAYRLLRGLTYCNVSRGNVKTPGAVMLNDLVRHCRLAIWNAQVLAVLTVINPHYFYSSKWKLKGSTHQQLTIRIKTPILFSV